MFAYLAIAGPGLIAANAGNDAAGIATYSSAGAQFVYRTLLFMVLVTVALVLVQEMAIRLGTYTGKGLAALIREQFSLRLTALALVCVLLANTGLVVSEFAGMRRLRAGRGFALPRHPDLRGTDLALVLFGSYRYAERIFLVFSLAFLAYPVAALLSHPHWSEVGANLVWPHFIASREFVLLGVALIGTTVSPYMQLYAAAGVVDRGATPDNYRSTRIDAITGAVFACLISITIIIATAATIGGQGPLDSAEQAAQALRPVAGPGAELLFAIGLRCRGPPIQRLCDQRSHRRRALRVPPLPGSPPVPGPVHRPSHPRRGLRTHPGQPDQAPDRHPDPPRHRGPDHAHLHPHPGQPAQCPGPSSQRTALPRRRHHRYHRTRRHVPTTGRPNPAWLPRRGLTRPASSTGRACR